MHGEPLHLIPQELRAEVEEELKIRIEGSLSPSCQMRLRTEYGGDIEQVKVEGVLISEDGRIGIGTFGPSDPKSQDIVQITTSTKTPDESQLKKINEVTKRPQIPLSCKYVAPITDTPHGIICSKVSTDSFLVPILKFVITWGGWIKIFESGSIDSIKPFFSRVLIADSLR